MPADHLLDSIIEELLIVLFSSNFAFKHNNLFI